MQPNQVVYQVLAYVNQQPNGTVNMALRASAPSLEAAQAAVKQLKLTKYVILCCVAVFSNVWGGFPLTQKGETSSLIKPAN